MAAVEIDPVHAAIHSFNFPRCAVIPQSVTELSGEDIRRAANIGTRKIDVVFGGAPCQGFSLIGQRALDDPRNELVGEFVRLVGELDADYFVFENVKGITVGRHVSFLEEVIAEFNRIGYQVQMPWRVLNASWFGVPQSRDRLFLMGCKKGLALPIYPKARFRAAGSGPLGELPEGPSCYDALSDLPDAERYRTLTTVDSVRGKWSSQSDYARAMHGVTRDKTDFSYPRVWDQDLLTSSMRTDHSDISRRRFKATPQGAVEPISRFFKLPASGVSNTLRAGTDSARGAFTSPRPIHFKYDRCITVREMARLHSFPDWFRFHQTKWHGARQIGNAVPPLMARAVAAEVISALGCKPVRPKVAIQLGEPLLLGMDMSQAASMFGIDRPVGKRDRKGLPKRRQWDERLGSALSL